MKSSNQEISLFDRKISPYIQALLLFGVVLVFDIFYILGKLINDKLFSLNTPWVTALAILLVFSVFCSVMSIPSKNQNSYWRDAIISYFLLMVAASLTAWAFSGLTIDEAGSFRWLYLVVTMGFVIFLAIVRTIRKIVFIAQKQDKRLRGEE